tara:strand:- start:665 stop:1048 length:384 start_codon:yes stop_codon:yes gene_type:complete
MYDLIIKISLSVLAILAPIQTAILGVGFLIVADLITGIVAAYKRGEPIRSERLKNTAVKMLVYNLLLTSSFIAETYLTPWIPFTNVALSFLAIIEVKSLGENFQSITGISFVTYLKSYLNNKLNAPK